MTAHAVEVPFTPAALALAGFAAGTSGTATAVGGPPIAIVLAQRPPGEARATMSLFFFVGSLLSIGWFAVQGQLPAQSWRLAVVLMPLVVAAFLAGVWARRRIPREVFRRAVLLLCAVAALVLLVRSLLG